MEQYRWLPLTKVRIPAIQQMLKRNALVQQVAAAMLNNRLTMLAAPAGSGKTTLAAMAVQATPTVRIAWLSLDREDNDPTTFMIALVTALQTIERTIGQWVLENLMTNAAQVDFTRLMGILVNDIEERAEEPLVVVLDDLHLLTDATVCAGLNYLLERIPAHLHLLATTRYEPPLALARLRAHGQLAEFRLNQLLFTTEETTHLLNQQLALALSPTDIARIQERSEGWIAGVRLLALSLGQLSPERRSDFLARLSSQEHYVFDLLAEEVLAQQPQEIRDFLLNTAILRELTPELCRQVTGRANAGDVLASLYRRNLFLMAVDGENATRTYRYHALFRDFLSQRLEQEAPQHVRELHRRAAAGAMPDRALYHYVQAQAWQEAADLLGKIGQDALWQGRYGILREWLAWIPTEVRHQYPWLLFLEGFLLYHDGHLPRAFGLLQVALQKFEANGDKAGAWETMGAMAGDMLMTMGRHEYYIELCQRLLSNPIPSPLRGRMLMGIAWWSTFTGNWDKVAGYVEEAMMICRTTHDLKTYGAIIPHLAPPFFAIPNGRLHISNFYREYLERFGENTALSIWAYITLASAAALEGNWQTMQKEVARARAALPYTYTTFYWNLNWLLTLMAIAYSEGDTPQLLATEAQLITLTRVPLGTSIVLGVLSWKAYRGWLYQEESALQEVQSEIARLAAEGLTEAITNNMAGDKLIEGIVAFASRHYHEAEKRFREVAASQQSNPESLYDHPDVRVLLAHLYLVQRHRDQAAGVIQDLFTYYEQKGEPGALIHHGDALIPLLEIAETLPSVRSFAAKVRSLWAELRDGRSLALPNSDESLTPREAEVLALLCTGASNRDIAERLVVTERTVKSHVTNILSKMGVTSRTQAVAKARELHLI